MATTQTYRYGLEAHLIKALNASLQETMDQEIKLALAKIERQMRETLAQKLIALIDTNITFETCGHDLRIVLKQAKGPTS